MTQFSVFGFHGHPEELRWWSYKPNTQNLRTLCCCLQQPATGPTRLLWDEASVSIVTINCVFYLWLVASPSWSFWVIRLQLCLVGSFLGLLELVNNKLCALMPSVPSAFTDKLTDKSKCTEHVKVPLQQSHSQYLRNLWKLFCSF